MLYPLVRPLLFRLDAERAHGLAIRALKALPAFAPRPPDPALAVRLAGLDFPNPIGLAAGFDKDGEVPDRMLGLGFGFVEVGTITPLPQPGNPKPRLFRLAEDRAVINRFGFNSRGQADAHDRLARRKRQGSSSSLGTGPSTSLRAGIVGVNIGANKDAADRIADYATGARRMADVADYLCVNISSPNTPGLRALQDEGALAALLAGVMAARSAPVPVFLKVAPDLEPADIDAIVRVAMDHRVAALIVANTTVTRPALASRNAGESGGLSGAPLRELALTRLRDFRKASGGGIALIAAGGIANAEDAYARIRAGAALVQLYSALVYEGPGLARRIARGLGPLLVRDGFDTIMAAIGTEA